MKKYELTDDCFEYDETWLYRIRAIRDFGRVKKGDLGGYIESEKNLSHDGLCWVSAHAIVYNNAYVCGNAKVNGIAIVSESAQVRDYAVINGDVYIRGNARIESGVHVEGDVDISGNALIRSESDYATISGFGSAHRTTTFFRLADGNIGVCSGCFYGTIEEFRKKVIETHEDTKYAKEYLMAVDMMEFHFRED